MAKRRKAKKKVGKSNKRAAPARRKKAAARKPARKAKARSAKPKRRVAKTKLPPRVRSASRPMSQPGPAVTPIAARPSPFPSSVPGDFPPRSPDGRN
jgi:hypothetical protein